MNSKSSDQTLEGRTRAGEAATSLGGQLRLAREARGVTLRQISDHTRISMRYLEAIEADDYKYLPGGIFNRSFIKAYAKYVEFDEDEALEVYSRMARERGDSPEEVLTTPQRSRIYMDGESSRSPLITALLSMVILAILSLGIYAALHWYQRRTTPPLPEDRAVGAAPSAPNAGTVGGAITENALPVTNAPPAVAAGGLQVQVRARGEPVWIRVRADEGEQTETTLSPDEIKEFAPESRLSLQYSKSKIEALEININGRPAKASADPKSSLVEMVITREDYEQFLQ